MKKRVVITGIGIISPLGVGVSQFWEQCLKAPDIVAAIPHHWNYYAEYASKIWAPLPEIDFQKYAITRVEMMQMDRTSLMALAASEMALDHAHITRTLLNEKKNIFSLDRISGSETGVFVGTGVGGACSLISAEANHLFTNQQQVINKIKECLYTGTAQQDLNRYSEQLQNGIRMPSRFNPFIVSMIMPNACGNNIGIRYSLDCRNETNCTACASGTIAIGRAYAAICQGSCQLALTGGVEYLNDDLGGIFRGFDIARTLVRDYDDPQKANRPFDKKRSGFLFCEGGCAILILESLEHAVHRHAPIIAEITGFAESYDAYNIMMMEPDGRQIEAMLRQTLRQASLEPDQIDYINTHGTGTQLNDQTEAALIGKIFGKKALVNSTKSLMGHSLGASGAIEAAVTALSVYHQTTHINKNLDEPIADLNFVKTTRDHRIRHAITQSFAFGGNNAALVMQQFVE